MSKTIEISREIAQRLLDGCHLLGIPRESPIANELRDLLAAPAVERQESVVSEADLIAAGFGYPMSKEDAVKAYKALLQPRTDHPTNEDCEHCAGCGHDYYGDPCVGCCKPSPVAFTTQGMLDIAKQIPLTGSISAKVTKDERWNVPLYTSPPAPVEVVLDERAEFENYYRDRIMGNRTGVRFLRSASGSYLDSEIREMWSGWQARACLDKVKEMNQ